MLLSLFSLLSTAPSQPQSLMTDSINATAVLVVWDPPLIPNGEILSYTVDIQISGSSPSTSIARVSADTTEEFGGLSPATMYVVTVRGMTSGGTGEAISLAVTTPPCEW